MENPLSCEDLSEDTLCAVDPKIDTKKIWKYKLRIDNKKELCGFAQKSLLKILISDTPIWSFTVIMINPKRAAYLPAKRKTNSTGTFSLELNFFFYFRDSNQSVRNFTNIVCYIFLRENTNTIVLLNPFDKKRDTILGYGAINIK